MPTKEQRERAKAVIQADATGRGYLLSDDGTMCVQAGLARDCGVPDERLRGYILSVYDAGLVRETFGLNARQLEDLQVKNDTHFDVEDRRAALTDYIDSLED